MIILKVIHCEKLEQLDNAADEIIQFCQNDKIWVFKGQMGAGKTTLIKSISKKYGIDDLVSSPTFAIVNEYRNNNGEVFYHFDFYRIEKAEEVLEIGVEEYFYSGYICWIEWAEKIPEYIPLDFVLINIEIEEGGTRRIMLERVINGEIHG